MSFLALFLKTTHFVILKDEATDLKHCGPDPARSGDVHTRHNYWVGPIYVSMPIELIT